MFKNKSVCQTINLGNGNPIKLIELVRGIEKELDKKATIKFVPYNNVEMKYTCADLLTSRKILNYEPKTSIHDGLAKFINWYKEHAYLYE